MISFVLLVALLGAVQASSSSSDSSDSSTSGLLARVNAGKQLEFDLGGTEEGTTSGDEDDDDTLTSLVSTSEKSDLRKAERAQRKADRIVALEKALEDRAAELLRAPRESYQAVFECPECETNDISLGPVVLIAKGSTGLVQDDHFDQNPNGPDGFDDVAFALNTWQNTHSRDVNNVEVLFADSVRQEAVSEFLRQVRNRASVNGGSIDLKALLLTGRTKLANGQESDTFATFGGADGRILISPCMPVINDPKFNYNVQVIGQADNFNALFVVNNAAQGVALADFLDVDEFADNTATFDLALFTDDDDATDNTVTGLGATFGSVTFERCAQFSYFA